MAESTDRAKQAKRIRVFRKIHRWLGMYLFVMFLVMSVTGVLLGLKKNLGGEILAKTWQGTTSELALWLPLDSLQKNAYSYLRDSVSPELSPTLDRIDIRKDKGTAKFIFADHYYGIQVDGATGKLLAIERRRADMIEDIHDGSIIDRLFLLPGEPFKIAYTTIAGLALLGFTITGFWLWYGPRKMRRKRQNDFL